MIHVKATNEEHWSSVITVAGLQCFRQKPDICPPQKNFVQLLAKKNPNLLHLEDKHNPNWQCHSWHTQWTGWPELTKWEVPDNKAQSHVPRLFKRWLIPGQCVPVTFKQSVLRKEFHTVGSNSLSTKPTYMLNLAGRCSISQYQRDQTTHSL